MQLARQEHGPYTLRRLKSSSDPSPSLRNLQGKIPDPTLERLLQILEPFGPFEAKAVKAEVMAFDGRFARLRIVVTEAATGPCLPWGGPISLN